MAEFPADIPTFTDLNGATSLAANNHAARHNKVHAEVAAIATRVGKTNSTDPSSHTKRIADLEAEVDALQAGSTNSVYANVTPTGAINGANTSFTVPHNIIATSLEVYKNGVRLKANGDDYTETANGFTMVTAPATGTRLLVDYMVSSGISNNADTVDGYHAADLILATKQALYPVGSIYTNADVATNPATLLGFGTWSAFATGRVMVGIDGSQTEFDAAGETGGAKTHTLTTAELPAHNHAPGTLSVRANVGNVAAGQINLDDFPGSAGPISATDVQVGNNMTGTTANTGSGSAHNNLQPYVVVYMWRRTA